MSISLYLYLYALYPWSRRFDGFAWVWQYYYDNTSTNCHHMTDRIIIIASAVIISICMGCLTGVVPPGAWWCHLVQPIKLAIWQLHKPCLILQKVSYTAMTSKQDKFRKSRKSDKSKYYISVAVESRRGVGMSRGGVAGWQSRSLEHRLQRRGSGLAVVVLGAVSGCGLVCRVGCRGDGSVVAAMAGLVRGEVAMVSGAGVAVLG
ncbi:hypothetical protein EDB89DRAFT_1912268 [Lactarius sanguifluus]|nr:hypothetical protein EDB89DRAFT_1912268 [Lactarius sanguifluus]